MRLERRVCAHANTKISIQSADPSELDCATVRGAESALELPHSPAGDQLIATARRGNSFLSLSISIATYHRQSISSRCMAVVAHVDLCSLSHLGTTRDLAREAAAVDAEVRRRRRLQPSRVRTYARLDPVLVRGPQPQSLHLSALRWHAHVAARGAQRVDARRSWPNNGCDGNCGVAQERRRRRK